MEQPVVVITGASSGIGRATALQFAKQGADLVLAGRNNEVLIDLAAECEARGGRALAVPTDVSRNRRVKHLARAARSRFGRIDVWVNAAAVSVYAPFVDVPLDDFRRVIDVNIMGVVFGSRAALRTMILQGSGVLVNVASVLGEVPQPYGSSYALSKAAVRSLDVSLRQELMLQGITGVHVSTILPATIDTPFYGHAANYTGRRLMPMPPLYPPQAVAKAIVRAVRSPKPEIVVGRLGRTFVRLHRMTPQLIEAQMAAQTDTMNLSRKQHAPKTRGILFEPATEGEVTGGWQGAERLRRRRIVGWGILVVGGTALLLRAARSPDAPPRR
ncbi:MAG: short-chain dehydrogenase [Rhodoglobus sp.]|nr:short-chain dehydrogenase [Rhodoglobus sp.]